MKYFWWIMGYMFPYKTKNYRKELYAKVFEYFENGYITGFCGALDSIEPCIHVPWSSFIWKLPELYRYKPLLKSSWELWWELDDLGITKRKEILKRIMI